MSMVMTELESKSGTCPRPECQAEMRVKEHQLTAQCDFCNLTFYLYVEENMTAEGKYLGKKRARKRKQGLSRGLSRESKKTQETRELSVYRQVHIRQAPSTEAAKEHFSSPRARVRETEEILQKRYPGSRTHGGLDTVPPDMWICDICNGPNLIPLAAERCPVCGYERNPLSLD